MQEKRNAELRKKVTAFRIEDFSGFKQKTLHWANQFKTVCYLDTNKHPTFYHDYECLIAADAVRHFYFKKNAFEELKKFYEKEKSWLFGFFTYDLKNQVEKLCSANFDGLGFPMIHFFEPKYLIEIQKDKILFHLHRNDARKIFEEISVISTSGETKKTEAIKNLTPRISRGDYLKNVRKIRKHIIEGDVYEMNYCQEFFAENVLINPEKIFEDLNKISRAPFSCYYKLNDQYLLCASPERFLKKNGNQLISQPIKGTIKRGKNKMEDYRLKNQLFHDEKERVENIMIVDLVRNDLARSSKPGSVKVKELFGIHSFKQVHQMISTITAELRKDVHFIDAIKNAFPMGSMTGAPKIMVMKLIEQYEKTKRGLYSGSVGYITPQGDFDFNVVIRSIIYNEAQQYLSIQAGGAIVYDSIPEKEFEECLLKAQAMKDVLTT